MSDLPQLPTSWSWTTLGEVTKIVSGSTPSSKNPSFWNGDIPWLAVSDLTGYSDMFIERGARMITEAGYEACSTQMVPKGTVLFSSRAPIGYVAIAAKPVCTSQGFKSFIPSEELNSDYLYWYLKSAKSLAESVASGTTFKELSGKAAGLLPIPLPPVTEQLAIVEEIERLMSLIDAGLEEVEGLTSSLDTMRATVWAAAVAGSLLFKEEIPIAGAAVELEAILARRRSAWEESQLERYAVKGSVPKNKSWKEKYPEPLKPTPIPDFELPAGWTWATIDQISSRVQYGSSAKTASDGDAEVPVLRMGNLFEGALSLEDLKYLPRDHSEFPELLLSDGDLLFNRTNSPELVGKTAVWRGELPVASFASYLIRVQLLDGAVPEFVSMFINSTYGRRWIRSVVSQQVGQANVNGTKLRSLTIPLPPAAVQHALVVSASAAVGVVGAVISDCRVATAIARSLKASLLRRAMAGELVQQVETGADARALLGVTVAESNAQRAVAKKQRAARARG